MARRAGTTQKDYQATLRRIQANRAKLSSMAAKGGKGVDMLTSQIEQDERLSELLLKRDDFVTYCILQELSFYNHYKGFVSSSMKDFTRTGIAINDKVRRTGWRSRVRPAAADRAMARARTGPVARMRGPRSDRRRMAPAGPLRAADAARWLLIV